MNPEKDRNKLADIIADLAVGDPFLLPVGVPLGATPQQQGSRSKYLLRRSGEFLLLDDIEYAAFCCAQDAPSRKTLASRLAGSFGKKAEAPDVVVEKLIEYGALVELSGVCEKDWGALRVARVIPRAIALGYLTEPAGSFALATPDGAQQLALDPISYAIWCRFDGATRLDAAVQEAIQDTGFTPSVIQARCEALVASAMRAGLALLDG